MKQQSQTLYRADNKKEKPSKAEKVWNAIQKDKRKAVADASKKKS